MSLDENKAGAAAVDPDDFNIVVDAVVTLQSGGGGGGGLPTGWTQDAADPANVDSHGGTLLVGSLQASAGGSQSSDVDPAGVQVGDSGTGALLDMNSGGAELAKVKPSAGQIGASFFDGNGATVAIDAGSMIVQNLPDPTNAQDADTKAARDTAITNALAAYTPPTPPAPGLEAVLLESGDAGAEVITGLGNITGNASINWVIGNGAANASIEMQTTGRMIITCTRLGFYGGSPIAQQEAPATPSAQDAIDILTSLGLCTQASP